VPRANSLPGNPKVKFLFDHQGENYFDLHFIPGIGDFGIPA
jgi:hypothetical protein